VFMYDTVYLEDTNILQVLDSYIAYMRPRWPISGEGPELGGLPSGWRG
jgi:hypothetical protein